MMNTDERTWSAMMRNEASTAPRPAPYVFPEICCSFSMIGQNSSVSKTVFLPWIMARVRSTPMPVSTVFCASGGYFPSAVLLYCMKTSFQRRRMVADGARADAASPDFVSLHPSYGC